MFSYHTLLAQAPAKQLAQGMVFDAISKETLPFVSIWANEDPLKGTISNKDGAFELALPDLATKLSFSCVGYETYTLDLSDTSSGQQLNNLKIELYRADINLEVVDIIAGEPPSHRIIRDIWKHKHLNDPANISSYSCEVYNKVVVDLLPKQFNSSATGKGMNRDQFDRLSNLSKTQHAGLMESFVERRFVSPDRLENHVIGNKVSGLKHPLFAVLSTDVQPFGFYEDDIEIMDKVFANPISKGCFNRYDFQLTDTLYQQNKDTVFVIAYQPKASKAFNGLKGTLFVNTNKYALERIVAEPANKGILDMRIEQSCALTNGQWFPEQLRFELIATEYPTKEVGMLVNGSSHIRAVNLNAELSKKDIGLEELHLPESAAEKDTSFWNAHRAWTLSDKERFTYKSLDSLFQESKVELLLDLLKYALMREVPMGPLSIDLERLVGYNGYEGLRLGFGMITNNKFNEHFCLGAYVGYGLNDKDWKYGTDLRVKLKPKYDLEWRVGYTNDLDEPGKVYLLSTIRGLLTRRMDRVRTFETGFKFRSYKFLLTEFSLSRSSRRPLYDYRYLPELNYSDSTQYTFTDLGIKLRYAHNERFHDILGKRLSRGSDHPTFDISYDFGLPIFGSTFKYHRLVGSLSAQFNKASWGKTRLTLESGIVLGDVPYPKLFNGAGSKIGRGILNEQWLFVKDHFQTMYLYEFAHDRFAYLFLRHEFPKPLFQTKLSRPTLELSQSFGWGRLSASSPHLFNSNEEIVLPNFASMDKGFYEAGLTLHDIIRIKILSVSYYGVGIGFYHRYGPYYNHQGGENYALRFSWRLSF